MMRIAATALILALAGCASTPTVHTDSDPSVDFRAYRTYSWLGKPDHGGVSPLVS